MDQSNLLEESSYPMPQDPYGIAKYAQEKFGSLVQTHNIRYTIVVPHNIIGPYQKYDDPFRNVLSIMINRNIQGLPSIIYGDGSQKDVFPMLMTFCFV